MKKDKKYSFTGLGLIFGTAIGVSLSMIVSGNVLWGGIGTAIGLIVGAMIDTPYASKHKE
jgi:hypothetical protein